jgi:phospholipid transport system substrate-binding protein
MTSRPIALVLSLLISLAAVPASFAQEMAPDDLIKAVTLEVLTAIRQDKDIPGGNPAKVSALVEARILPLFDFAHMTQIAAARSWNVATPGQRILLAAEFKTLLVRTYSIALTGYHNQEFEFKPLRAAPGETSVTVKSVVKQSGTAPVTMDYEMEKMATGWKVFDITIDGISLITTYREAFANKVRESGVDGLIKSLAEKNRAGDARIRVRNTGDFYIPVLFHGLVMNQAGTTAYISNSR